MQDEHSSHVFWVLRTINWLLPNPSLGDTSNGTFWMNSSDSSEWFITSNRKKARLAPDQRNPKTALPVPLDQEP